MTTGSASTTRTSPLATRILVLTSELPPGPGGIGTHAYELAKSLQHRGYEVSMLGSQHYVDDAERRSFNSASPVAITSFIDHSDPLRTAVSRYRQILSAVRRERPDVVVASGGRVLWLAALACPRLGVPVLAVVHGSEVGGPSWQRSLTRWALNRAKAVVAVSYFTRGLTTDLGVRPSHVEVIHNGADGSRFSPDGASGSAFRARHGLGDGPLIMTVGNVTQRKGQHQVVAALPRVLEAVPDARYAAVGRPTDGEQLMAQAAALGVADRVHLLGQLPGDEIPDAYRAGDVFAMTSTATADGDVEGYGIAVVEAALCGVPAVVTAGTGAQEAVDDGQTGLVVQPGAEGVAEGIISLLIDTERRQRLGATARDRAVAEGTWDSRAGAYSEVIDRVARGARPRMLVVSHTEHYRDDDGGVVGFGPTLRELNHLAALASELVHVAPLHAGPAPAVALPYRAPNIRFVPAATAGGPRPLDRVRALRVVPSWIRVINRELGRCDVVHVRAPAGISMVAMVLLMLRRRPRARWIKYAGNWMPESPDAVTYRLQRWWLRRGLSRASVTVNGKWPDQPRWVNAFDNPTLTDEELVAGHTAATERAPGPPFRLVFVGRIEEEKGAAIAVRTVQELRSRGLSVSLDLIGDGPLRPKLETNLTPDLEDSIVFHGWLPRTELEIHLAQAHVMLLPTRSEGFPKAVAEALAFGCVPVTSGVSSMGQVLGETGGAVVVEPGSDWADAVADLLTGGQLPDLQAQAVAAVTRFSYATYLDRVRALAERDWGVAL